MECSIGVNIGWHCLLLLFIASLNMGLVRLSRRRSIVVSISVFRRLWLIPHHSSPLFLEKKCSGCSSSGSGGPIDVAGASDVQHFVFEREGGRVVDDRQVLRSRCGGLTRPKRAPTAEVNGNKNNSDQSNDKEGEEGGPDNGGGGGGGGEVVMEEVGKLLVGNGIIRGEVELGIVSLDFF